MRHRNFEQELNQQTQPQVMRGKERERVKKRLSQIPNRSIRRANVLEPRAQARVERGFQTRQAESDNGAPIERVGHNAGQERDGGAR